MTYSFPPRNWVAEGLTTRLATDEEFGAYLYIAEQRETEPFTEDTKAILTAWKAANPHVVNAVPSLSEYSTPIPPHAIALGDETEV
jgi:hypothetical protein